MQSQALFIQRCQPLFAWVLMWLSAISVGASPANRAALEKHYDRFLVRELAGCSTCHLPSAKKNPENLEEFPHNPFGNRLRLLGEELQTGGKKKDLPVRLALIAKEDTDGDGTANELELLLGHNPGDPLDVPSGKELATGKARAKEFESFLTSYRWQPFEPVKRPLIPPSAGYNPIDSFLEVERQAHGLKSRPEASREVLLRRVYLDLTGLNPTPEEQDAYFQDNDPQAYERLVDRLLVDSRHGERWARHWMDVWRYSDWAGWADGNQIRDSKPHIWRWRDWIVDSVNRDKPYDRMIVEMLAADELAPEDTDALRATGFLVRNYKMLSREQWLEDTVKHTSQGFMGLTMGCAKCHDHMFDPITQREYFEMRAIFEPHQVRTDRIPGQSDRAKDGLVRAFDSTNTPTFLLVRGDERHPLTNEIIHPGVPSALGGALVIQEIKLPDSAVNPDRRDFVLAEARAVSKNALTQAQSVLQKILNGTNTVSTELIEAELEFKLAEQKDHVLSALIDMEPTPANLPGATNLGFLQRQLSLTEAQLKQHRSKTALNEAQKKAEEAAAIALKAPVDDKASRELVQKAANTFADLGKKSTEATTQLAEALTAVSKPRDATYKPRGAESYASTSTGRRLAFARWVTHPSNPLTARVAVNHLWQHHFGRGLVGSPSDFGRNGRTPTHPQLLDWLAAEFISQGWSMKAMHRLMLTSAAYRMASTPESAALKLDPDNVYLWRMNSRRLEAEVVRDNLLSVAGTLDPIQGGPDIDHTLAMTSVRRSIYLRHAAEKQAEFLQIFDGASVTECYERHPSVMPQQALAMSNSDLPHRQAKHLAKIVGKECNGDETAFVRLAFKRILARVPSEPELQACLKFLMASPVANSNQPREASRPAENLMLVLLNHNDFVTVR